MHPTFLYRLSPLRRLRTLPAVLAASVFALAACHPAHAGEIVIGQSTALSGVLASSGEPMRLGAQLCFDMVNASGGINGRKIRFISKDDEYKVERTVANVVELTEKEGAVVLLGGSGTTNNEALLQQGVLQKAGIALVGPRTGGSSLREPFNPWLFHVRASYAEEVGAALRHFTSVGFRSIGFVYQDDSFGKDGLAAGLAALARAGIEPAFTATYERNSTRVGPAVEAALAARAQAILLLTTTAPTAEFARLYREAGGNAQLLALSINDAQSIMQRIGVRAAHGLAFTTVFPSPSRTDFGIVKEYHAALRKFGPAGAQASVVSLEGYIVAKVIVEALRRAGPQATRESVMKSLETLKDADLGGFWVSYGARQRAGSHYVDISIINKNGLLLR